MSDTSSQYCTVFVLKHPYDPDFILATSERGERVESLEAEIMHWLQARGRNVDLEYTMPRLYDDLRKQGYDVITAEDRQFPQNCQDVRRIERPIAGDPRKL